MIIYDELGGGERGAIKLFLVLSVIFAAVFLAALSIYYGVRALNELNTYNNAAKFTITVSGEGSIFASPDIAKINLTVRSSDPSLAAVTASNNEKNNQVVSFLKSKGVDPKDIRTVSYNVSPQYQYDSHPCFPGGPCVQSPPKIVGYEAINSLEVKVRNLDKVGEILSGAVSAGANEVSGPYFTIDDETKYKEEARAQAIAKAEDAAQKLAQDLHIRILRIKYYTEPGGYGMYAAPARDSGLAIGGPSGSPTIAPGQNEIKVTVNIVYEVR